MLSLYEILKASKTGLAPDMWTALAGMNWSGADSGHEVKELTGIPPLSFTADGTPLLDFLISGDMAQSGTPTPSSPIQPQETGDLETTGEHSGQYKIPISSGGTTTPVYLGEVQSTRRIKRLVFDGTEPWNAHATVSNLYTLNNVSDYLYAVNPIPICSHYPTKIVASAKAVGNNELALYYNQGQPSVSVLYIKNTEIASADDFKTYLQQQYANGTPVTVWYVLATEETGIVNEPLRKIGDYADTVSMEQAGVQIPTNRGNTVIDVETALKPSEVYIKYYE